MEKWTDRWRDGWTDRWTDEGMDGFSVTASGLVLVEWGHRPSMKVVPWERSLGMLQMQSPLIIDTSSPPFPTV